LCPQEYWSQHIKLYFSTMKPLITNTSKEFIKCRILHFLIVDCCRYSVSQKHGNSVTNSISSLLWISIVLPKFKSHNIIMSARVYFMKRVKDCKDEFIMSPQDEQWRRTSLLCLYAAVFLFYQEQLYAVKT